MNRFEERIEQGFDRFAGHATPSPTAFDTFRTRIAEDAEQPEVEIIMLQKNDQAPARRSRMWMAAAAAVIAVVAGLIVVNRGEDTPPAVVDDPPAPSVVVNVTIPDATAAPTTLDTTATSLPPLSQIAIVGTVDVDLVEGELIDGSGTGTFEVSSGAEVLGCDRGTIEEIYSFQAQMTKVMTCTSGTRMGTFTIDAGGLPGSVSWDVVGATGDFVGLSGTGTYDGREIYQDEESFGNPIYVWDPVSEYSETMTGTIGFD